MNWDQSSLRSFILSIVKPLKSGKMVSQSGKDATLDNLIPTGVDSNFRATSPFGFISKVPTGISVFYNSLFGSSYENIILGHLHLKRPEPSAVGETILYSTTENGTTIKAKITLKNDGTLVIEAPLDINVTCQNANITASTKVGIACDNIELGSGAVEKILNGETFQTFFNAHTHQGNIGYPTGAPLTPSTSAHLSSVVKAKK